MRRKLQLGLTLVVGTFLMVPVPAVAQTPAPNVVVIITDDVRIDQITRMPTVQTELVSKGTTFTNMFIQDPLCCPSRVAFLRGQMAHTTGTYNVEYSDFGGWKWVRRAGLENETLAVWLDRAGYFTAEAGKYLNGYDALIRPPGWDYWRGKRGGYSNFSIACIAPDPSCPQKSVWQVYGSTNPGYEADEAAIRAVEAIGRSGDDPLFGWFSFYGAHSPWEPSARYANETTICGDADLSLVSDPGFNERATDAIDGTNDKPRWIKSRAAYTASQISQYRTRMIQSCRTLLAVDDGVSSILAALEAKDPGLANTYVIFTSDQGVQNGEHMHAAKSVPYDSTAKVPFVVRGPGLPAGVTNDAFLSNIDLAPTVVDLASATATPDCPTDPTGGYRASCLSRGGGFDGISFAPLLLGEPFDDRDAILIEFWDPVAVSGKPPTFCSLRTMEGQLTRYYQDAKKGIDWEGYDLVTDPQQLHSVVYSNDASGIPRFRPGGQALYDALYPQLKSQCNPLPGGGGVEYPAFP